MRRHQSTRPLIAAINSASIEWKENAPGTYQSRRACHRWSTIWQSTSRHLGLPKSVNASFFFREENTLPYVASSPPTYVACSPRSVFVDLGPATSTTHRRAPRANATALTRRRRSARGSRRSRRRRRRRCRFAHIVCDVRPLTIGITTGRKEVLSV